MRFANDITLSLRVVENAVEYIDHTSVLCAFPKQSGKEQNIVVYDISKTISKLKKNDFFTVTRGMLRVTRHKFTGKTLFSVHGREFRFDTEQRDDNRWHLSVVLDKPLSDKEKTARWSVCHVYPEMEQYFLELKSANNVPDIKGYRQNDMLIVTGAFDFYYNSITRRPVFSILAEEVREDIPETVPIPNSDCFDENEIDIANFLSAIGYCGDLSFNDPEEIIEHIDEFNEDQKLVIKLMQKALLAGNQAKELVKKADSLDIPAKKSVSPSTATAKSLVPEKESIEHDFSESDMYRMR